MVKKDYPFAKIVIGDTFSSGISTHVDWKPRTNVIEMGDWLVVEVELPGVDKSNVSIVWQGNSELIIKGNKPQPRQDEPEVTYHLFEREFGTFYKKIAVHSPVDPTKIESTMDNGLLVIRVPRKEKPVITVDIK